MVNFLRDILPFLFLIVADMLTNYIFLAIGIVGAACTDVKQTFLQVSQREVHNFV